MKKLYILSLALAACLLVGGVTVKRGPGGGGDGNATSITDGIIVEADLDADEAPVDNDILTFDTTGDNFSWQTPTELVLQPLEATLTDIADGTIAENLVNTANPWAANEVADSYIINSAGDVMAGTLTADGLTLGANENITLGAQTLDHDGTDFVFNDNLKATSFETAASATPKLTLDDSDGADGYMDLNAADAADAVLTIGVDDSNGDDQQYIELDGVNKRVEFTYEVRLMLPAGAAPALCLQIGELFLDTDENDDTTCITASDNSLCVCTAAGTPGTWASTE